MSGQLYRIGNQEKTIKQWAQFYCVPWRRVYNRMSKLGWTIEEALTTPKIKERSRLLTVGNVTRSLRWWSKKQGIPLSTIQGRIAAGKTPEEVVSQDYLRHETLTLWGRTQTVAEWVAERGVKYQTLYYRTRHAGMSIEAALTMPVTPNGPRRRKT